MRPIFELATAPLIEQFLSGLCDAQAKPATESIGLMAVDRRAIWLYSTKVLLSAVDLSNKYVIKSVNRLEVQGVAHATITLMSEPGAPAPTKEMFQAVAAYALGVRGNRMCGIYPDGWVAHTWYVAQGTSMNELVDMCDSVRVEYDGLTAILLLGPEGLFVMSDRRAGLEIRPVSVRGSKIDFQATESLQRPLTLYDGQQVTVLNSPQPRAARLHLGGDNPYIEVLEANLGQARYIGPVEGKPLEFAQVIDGQILMVATRAAEHALTQALQGVWI